MVPLFLACETGHIGMNYTPLNDNWEILFSFHRKWAPFPAASRVCEGEALAGAFVNLWAALIEPVAVYNCRLDPTRLPVEFIFRACPPGSDTASEHQGRPDGRRFKQAAVCCGCFEHRWRGGRGGERLPTVFNLAATRLSFRAGDKEMREAGGLSHSLNIEFRRYPQASVQHFTEVFFQTAHWSHIFLFVSLYRPPDAFNVTVTFVLLPQESLSLLFAFLLQWSNKRMFPNSVWIIFDPDDFRPSCWMWNTCASKLNPHCGCFSVNLAFGSVRLTKKN